MDSFGNIVIKLLILCVTGVCATLTWSRRMKIALDAAKGLAFLHDAERPIIYRDFKTSNILLDAVSHTDSFLLKTHDDFVFIISRIIFNMKINLQDLNAKLSDFGLAKDGPMGDQTHVSTQVMGT